MNISEITEIYYEAVVDLEKYLKMQKENVDKSYFGNDDNKKQLVNLNSEIRNGYPN